MADAVHSQMNRWRLFAILAALYLAQSIPGYLFVAAIPPIMREGGVSKTEIGLLSLLFLPLIAKFLWAPWVDRLRPLAIGHRAGWVLVTQAGIVATMVVLAFADPRHIWTVLALGILIATLLSTQDIATDGYATKMLPEADRPIGNAIQGGAVAFGVVIGGTLGLVLYEQIGWTAAVLTIATVSTLPIVAALMMREDDPRAPPQPQKRPSLANFLRRPEARHALAIALIYRASEGLMKAMEYPYMVDRGVPLGWIGYLSGGAAITAGLLGTAAAALLLKRMGTTGVLMLLGGLRTLCFLLFFLHAVGWVAGYAPLFGSAAFQTLIRYMEIVALYGLFMGAASKDQPGTDFTILACAQLVVYMAGSSIAGVLADKLGYGALFALSTVISAIAVIATGWLFGRRDTTAVPDPGKPVQPV